MVFSYWYRGAAASLFFVPIPKAKVNQKRVFVRKIKRRICHFQADS